MAGYKKQSKKSPLKKYGRRDVRKLDVSEQKATYKSNATAQGSLGRAVGAVGQKVGEAVDTIGDKNSRGKLTNKQKKQAAKDKAKRDQGSQLSGLKTPAFDTGAKALETDTKLPELQSIPPKKPAAVDPPAPPAPITLPAVGPLSQEQDANNPWLSGWGAQAQPQQQQRPQQTSVFGDWYNPQHPGSGNIVTAQGKDQQSPINRISPEYTKSPFRRNPYGKSPMKRMSPFKAKADEISAGSQYVDQMQRSASPSYLGQEGAAATEGYNLAVDRHNYKQRVWAEKGKDLDDAYGKLTVEPTGASSWDASVQNMAKEWKDEFTNLYNNKDQYSYEEYAQKLSDIKGRAGSYQDANNQIKTIVAEYDKNKDNISASTPPETVDMLETLAKGGDGLTVGNVNGVPTLSGVTLGGQEVSVPISEIASGKNLWRFNNQVDIQPDIDKLGDTLGKFKTQIAQNSGLTTQTVGWDQLAGRASNTIDGWLSNPQKAQAIAADRFGIDNDEWKKMEATGQDPVAVVKQRLLTEVQEQFAPHQQVQSFSADPRVAAQQAQQRIDIAKHNATKGTAGERSAEETAKFVNERLQGMNEVSIEGLNQFKGIGKISNVSRADDGTFGIKVGKEWIELDSDPTIAKQQIASYAGVKVGNLDNALPRSKNPFKRMMDFLASPFKRNSPLNSERPIDGKKSLTAAYTAYAKKHGEGEAMKRFGSQSWIDTASAADIRNYFGGKDSKDYGISDAEHEAAARKDFGNAAVDSGSVLTGVGGKNSQPEFDPFEEIDWGVDTSAFEDRGDANYDPRTNRDAEGFKSQGDFLNKNAIEDGRQWVKDWYDAPETRERLKKNQGYWTDWGIDQDVERGLDAKAKGVSGGNVLPDRANAMYNPNNHTYNFRNTPGGRGALPHEFVHATGIDDKTGDQMAEILGEPNPFSSQAEYLANPREQYGNLTDIRSKLGLKPSERNLTPAQLRRRIQKWERENGEKLENGMFEAFGVDKITKALNKVASVDKKRSKDSGLTRKKGYKKQSKKNGKRK